MLARILRRLPIRKGEWGVTLLMLSCIFGVMTFYYILKPLRSGLFLRSFPSSHLPYAYFLTAFFAGSLATLFFKLSRRISAITFLTATNLAIIATLLYFRWAMGREIHYLPYVYFVYVQIISVLSTAQFWLLAGYVFDNQQSKRIFPILGSGAIAGAMAGSFVPAFLSRRLETPTMLLICVSICILLTVLSQLAWRRRRPESDLAPHRRGFEEKPDRLVDLLQLIFGSRHLLLVAVLVFLTLIASQISDWQLNDAAQSAFSHLPKPEQEKMINSLFGRFYFVTNILGILLQLSLSAFVVRNFGIGTAILFLPGALFLSAIGVILAPTLWTAVIALGSNSVFRYSINRVGFELLYLPLSPEVRKRIKVFIDVFIDRFGRAVAGLIVLALTGAVVSAGLRGTAVAIAILTAACVMICLMLRRSYVDAFRKKLARGEVDVSEVHRYISDPQTVRLLLGALESGNERQILYALGLLQSSRGVDFSAKLIPLLTHPSASIRESALRTLPAVPVDHSAEVERLLEDSSENVRWATVDYLCSTSPPQLQRLLADDDINIRLAVARWMAEHPESGIGPSKDFISRLQAGPDADAWQSRAAVAELSAILPASPSLLHLRRSLADPDPKVQGAAARASGRAGHRELVLDLLPLLTRGPTRGAARGALVAYGPRVVGTLGDVLGDVSYDLAIRRQIPWVLARIPTRRSADALVDNLGVDDPLLKYRDLKALNRIRDVKPELPGARPAIAARIYAETRAYYESLLLYRSLTSGSDGPASGLLERALRERIDQNMEIVFRLLGLQYPQKDIYFAYAALKEARPDRRASAIEFLDNLLQKDVKSIILPLVEEPSLERLAELGSRQFGLRASSRVETLRQIAEASDLWLKTCALHEIGERRLQELSDVCRRYAAASDPGVRETALWALARCA
ncbi:MAG: hypothetical protein HYX75_24090 [Acidobacteria bacterium]|nr:hypothetical protein [Acidobacteriota bacterium]